MTSLVLTPSQSSPNVAYSRIRTNEIPPLKVACSAMHHDALTSLHMFQSYSKMFAFDQDRKESMCLCDNLNLDIIIEFL